MSKRSIVVFCLISIIYIAAATMVYNEDHNKEKREEKKEDDKKTKSPNKTTTNSNCNNNEDLKTSDCKLDKNSFSIDENEKNNEIEENDVEDEEEEGGNDESGEGEELDEQEEEEEEEEEEEQEIKMFGVSLIQLMEFQESMNGDGEDDDDQEEEEEKEEKNKDKIPFILEVMMDKVKELNGFQTEGIFRINGNMKDVEDLATNGFDPYSEDLNQYEVHTWASLLKKWIRELPDPLIPEIVYTQLFQLLSTPSTPSPKPSPKSKSKSKKNRRQHKPNTNTSTTTTTPPQPQIIPIHSLSPVLKSIQPTVFYDVFESLGLFFAELLQPDNVKSTKIDIDSITTIITPTIFKPKIEVSQENLASILSTQTKEKLIFKSILYYYIDEFKHKQLKNESDQ